MHVETSGSVLARRRWTWQRIARILLVLLAAGVVLWLLWRTGNNLLPFVLGLVLAYLIQPLVRRLNHYMPRWLAILVVYLIGFGSLIFSIVLLIPALFNQIQGFAESLPGWYEGSLQPRVNQWLVWYRESAPTAVQQAVEEQLANAQQTLQENASQYASGVTLGILSAVTGIFRTLIFLLGFLIVPFWLFYVLKDHEQAQGAIDRMVPEAVRADFWAIVGIFDRIFSSYIRGQLLLGLIVAIFSFIGLSILKLAGVNVKYVLLLSLIAGITELIPVIGPLLGAIPAIIVGSFDSASAALWVALLYLIVQQVENNVLVPRIIGEALEIHPAILMLLLVVAGAVAGLLGVILVAPLAAVARDVFNYLYRRLKETDPSTVGGAPGGVAAPGAVAELAPPTGVRE